MATNSSPPILVVDSTKIDEALQTSEKGDALQPQSPENPNDEEFADEVNDVFDEVYTDEDITAPRESHVAKRNLDFTDKGMSVDELDQETDAETEYDAPLSSLRDKAFEKWSALLKSKRAKTSGTSTGETLLEQENKLIIEVEVDVEH